MSAENFLNDWARILESELQRRGVKLAPGKDHQKISFAYWNAVHRYITPNPRTVVISDIFCCRDEDQPGLMALKGAFERGDDVNAYLSNACRDADDPWYHDRLLNDWGIHHLHLGALRAGQVERTAYVLFARITDDATYLITTLNHDPRSIPKDFSSVWARQLLLGSLHRNWPDSISDWRADNEGTRFPNAPLTDKDIGAFRGRPELRTKKKILPAKGSVMVMPKLPDGAVYFPLGEGSTASGLSNLVLDTSNWYCNRVAQLHDCVAEQTDKVSFPGISGHPARRVSSGIVHGNEGHSKAEEARRRVQA